jgi:hypothetical protein
MPLRVEQRPARIAGVDRGVGLNRAFNPAPVARLNRALQAADDAGREGAVEAERVADGQNLLPDDEPIGIAERHDRQFLARRVDLYDGEVRIRIAPDDARRVALLAAEIDAQRIRPFDDVIVGQDVALLVNDRAGAGTLPALAEVAARARHRSDKDDARRDGLVDLDVVALVRDDRRVRDALRRSLREGGARRLQAVAVAVVDGDSDGGEGRREERDD